MNTEEHGTKGWALGCRCAACITRAAHWRDVYHSDAARKRPPRLKVDLPDGTQHGDPRGASTYGCGCHPCKATYNIRDKVTRAAVR